jgi:hypothetical protein
MSRRQRNLRILTTKLTSGECIDRLRRISKRDDGQTYDRKESIFAQESLLLAKTPDGFTLRSRARGSLPLEPVLEVRFEEGTSGMGTKLVAGIGDLQGAKTLGTVGTVFSVAFFGVVLWSAFREHEGYATAVSLAFCALAAIGITLVIRRARWGGKTPRLLEVVRAAVEGDEWR